MSLLNQVIKEYGMDPKQYGIQGLAATVDSMNKGEPYELGFTTYLKQRTQAEEEEDGVPTFSQNPNVDQLLHQMYASDSPYSLVYAAVKSGQLSNEDFEEVLTYYGKN